ncbi:MAG: hypothetical protein QOF36_139 [Microbacteriaceae bacterium]|nr:hypothetical protein [Microbacteriaceae bacterium]
MPDSGDVEAWREVLNELWRRSRDALDSGPALAEWTPPAGLGPIPVELIPRAASLVESQRIAIANVRARKDDVSARLRIMKQVPQLFHEDIPVYVDRVG